MSFETDFLDFMPDVITVKSVTSRDEFGVPTFGTSRTFRCRQQPGDREVRAVDGEQKVATLTLYCPSTNGAGAEDLISPEDEVILPDGRTPLIWAVYHARDDGGSHHQQVYAAFERGRPR